jgi:methanogenic corrinoid protein MtbC1
MNEERGPAPSLPPVDPRRADRLPPDVVTAEMLAGLLVEGDHDLVTWALRVALAGRAREDVYDTLVRDAMRLVGEGWHEGRWTVSEEHRATQTLIRALEDVAPAPSPADRIGPTAVLATVEGEQHAIGLILLEHLLREGGWSVAYLGQSVPVDDLVRYAARERCDLVALSAALPEHLGEVSHAVAALRAMPRPPAVMVGGRALGAADRTGTASAAGGAGVSAADLGADWAGGTLRSAQRFAADLLTRIAPPGAGRQIRPRSPRGTRRSTP